VYGTLRRVCDSAVANDLLIVKRLHQVTRHVRPRQVAKSRPGIVTSEQLAALVAVAEKRTPSYAASIAFLAYTDSRAREAPGLRWGDVDTTAKLVTFAHQIDKAGTGLVELKTESAQRINALTPVLDRFLGKTARMKAKWSGDDDYVFASATRTSRSPRRSTPTAIGSAAEQAARVAEAIACGWPRPIRSARASPDSSRLGLTWEKTWDGPGLSPSRKQKDPVSRAFVRADDGARTHDLLHGKQTL
jgi:integrase